MKKKTVQKSSTKGNAKSSTKSNSRKSVKSSAKNSPQKAVKNVAPTVESVSVKQAVIIQEPSVEQNEQNIPTRLPDLGPRRSVAFIGSECYPFVKTGGLDVYKRQHKYCQKYSATSYCGETEAPYALLQGSSQR